MFMSKKVDLFWLNEQIFRQASLSLFAALENLHSHVLNILNGIAVFCVPGITLHTVEQDCRFIVLKFKQTAATRYI